MIRLLDYCYRAISFERYRRRMMRLAPFDPATQLSYEPSEAIVELCAARKVGPMEFEAAKGLLNRRPLFDTWPEHTIVRRDRILVHPNGTLTDHEYRLFPEWSMWGGKAYQWSNRVNGIATVGDDTPVVDRAFWVGCGPQQIYYHWIIEALTRLALARDWLVRERIPVIAPLGQSFHHEALDRLFPDLPRVPWPATGGVRVRECYYVNPAGICGVPDPKLVAALQSVASDAEPSGRSLCPIWIDRGAASRPVRTSPGFGQQLEALGYERLVPEKLSFAEQLTRFSSACVLAGGHGAGLANMVWMMPGARTVEVASAFHNYAGYTHLARASGHDHRLVQIDRPWRRLASVEHANRVPLQLNRSDERRVLEALRAALN